MKTDNPTPLRKGYSIALFHDTASEEFVVLWDCEIKGNEESFIKECRLENPITAFQVYQDAVNCKNLSKFRQQVSDLGYNPLTGEKN